MLTAAVVTKGELLVGSRDKIVSDVCVDSRSVTAGCLFVAMAGEHVDGHDFADSAINE